MWHNYRGKVLSFSVLYVEMLGPGSRILEYNPARVSHISKLREGEH